jgi:hypothetical protein
LTSSCAAACAFLGQWQTLLLRGQTHLALLDALVGQGRQFLPALVSASSFST